MLLHQNGTNRFIRYGMQSGIGFDWTLKKNSLSGDINYNRFGNNSNGIINLEQQTTPFGSGDPIADIAYINHLNNQYLSHSADASLHYTRNFKKEDQTLEIELNTSHDNNSTRGGNAQTLLPEYPFKALLMIGK